jgi:hypothetical protein
METEHINTSKFTNGSGTEHINASKFTNGSETWPSSVTVNWDNDIVILTRNREINGKPFYVDGNTGLQLSKHKVYTGNLLISKEEFSKNVSDLDTNQNTLEWKDFWCLDNYEDAYNIRNLINIQVSGDIKRIDTLLENSPITSGWYDSLQSNFSYPNVCSENLLEDSKWYHNFTIVRTK